MSETAPQRADRLGAVLLGLSAAGLPLGRLAIRHLGRRGGLLVVAGCGILFTRNLAMALGGAAGRLRPVPRALLLLELASSATAVVTGLRAWVFAGPAGSPTPLATGAVNSTFALHTARQAIYLSPGHGRLRTPLR